MKPTQIHTILGSCVSVCLYDPIRRYGAMNHILLPGRGDPLSDTKSARFGVNAMELTLREFAKQGIANRYLKAKVFGGATSSAINGRTDFFKVAERNVQFIHEFLATEGIQIIVEDTGGSSVRLVHFFSDTCKVYVKKTSLASSYVAKEEVAYKEKVTEAVEKIGGNYVLF